MIKKILLAATTFFAAVSLSWAQVDINTASEAQLQTVKGIGAARAKQIVEERTKNGAFKSSADLATRVKGIGDKSATKLISNGLSVPGSEAAAAAGVANLKGQASTAATAATAAATSAATKAATQTAVPAVAPATAASTMVKPAALPAAAGTKMPAVPVPPAAAPAMAPAPAPMPAPAK